jgi:hypothetical protein
MVGTIKCTSLDELAIVCAELARQGVVFNAYTNTLLIELTGGY